MSAHKNVVLLMTDQQRWDTIHALGNQVIKTPNLDRLCRRGVAFTSACTNVPVCAAARHRLFTGADSRTIGEVNSKLRWHPRARPVQSVLAEAGYKTGGFGKMHFKNVRDSHGFMHFKLHEEMQAPHGLEYRKDDDYLEYLAANGYDHVRYGAGVRNLLYFQPQISPIPEEHHETRWVGDQALDFIDAFHRVPFFCFASWMQPHWPVHVPSTWADMYRVEDMEEPVWSEAEQEHLPFTSKMGRLAADMADPGKPPAVRRMLRSKALYYASISFIDHQIGRILERLERYNLLDDTLIVMTADHGEMLFDHLSTGKCVAYDPSIRVPFIVAGPGMADPGSCADDCVSHLDFAPTVYEFTGVEPPAGTPLAGASLLGERRQVRERDALFSEIGEGANGGFVCIRTRRWKYAFYHQGGRRQLFDLDNDPHELDNLLVSAPGDHEAAAADLHRRLREWCEAHSTPSRFAADGEFVVVEEPPVPADRNNQTDRFEQNLTVEESARLWSEARSVYEAIKDEPCLDPADLDLEFWERKRGPGCIAELESLLGRKLRPGPNAGSNR